MTGIDDILSSIDENRRTFATRLSELRHNTALDERLRRRRIKDTWIAAMRRHYRLVDEYLILRDWGIELAALDDVQARHDVQANELWAPSRPDEVPASIRPNLVTEISEQLAAIA